MNTQLLAKVLIVFDRMIADMIIIKRPNQIVTELFIRGKNSTFLLVLSQSYFAVPKDVKLNCTHFFIIKILKK